MKIFFLVNIVNHKPIVEKKCFSTKIFLHLDAGAFMYIEYIINILRSYIDFILFYLLYFWFLRYRCFIISLILRNKVLKKLSKIIYISEFQLY